MESAARSEAVTRHGRGLKIHVLEAQIAELTGETMWNDPAEADGFSSPGAKLTPQIVGDD